MQFVDVRLLAIGLSAMAATAVQSAHAGNFVYTTIDVHGAFATYPTSVNDAGVVAGTYQTAANSSQYGGFLWSNGTFTTFTGHDPRNTVGGPFVTNGGMVAFTAGGSHGNFQTALIRRPDGQVTTIKTPLHGYSWVYGANNHGQIVGDYSMGGSADRYGFLAQDRQAVDLSVPGAANTFPVAINDQGVVAGWYGVTSSGPLRGFYYENGAFTTFDPPGSNLTVTETINHAGDIAGYYYTPQTGTGTFGFVLSHGHFHKYKAQPGNERDVVTSLSYVMSPDYVAGNFYNIVQQYAFTYANGVYTRMAPFNATVSFVNAGNSAGTLVGGYVDDAKVSHGFIAVCPAGQAPCTN